ncbi:MAG: ABC transporter permease [Lachnospiraceae bacterium]|nr:ABC transporter permease [Lachnospiraceae bacterium]
MTHDIGLMIFFVMLPLAYPIVYTLIYNPEVVTDVSVVVVDDSRTQASRQLVRQASATPAFGLYGYAANMSDAKEIWANHDAYAILRIPADFGKNIGKGEQARATLYCDMSLLLRYRALLSAMTDLQIALASDMTSEKIGKLGAESIGAGEMPVESNSHFLGDTQQGFASFVIPGIIVLILQQSMILGVGLLGATSRERRRANGGIDPMAVPGAGPASTAIGKALAYVVFYIPLTIYVLHFIPWMFSLPHIGAAPDYLLFIFPMLLATAFLGQAVVPILKEREYVFLAIVFTSVIFLFLSGLTWPRYAMSEFWRAVGSLVPATWGVEGFIRINSNGATLGENGHPYLMMWILAAAYFLLAIVVGKLMSRSKG